MFAPGDKVLVEMVVLVDNGEFVFVRPRDNPRHARVAIGVLSEFVSPSVVDVTNAIFGAILALRKEVLSYTMTDQEAL